MLTDGADIKFLKIIMIKRLITKIAKVLNKQGIAYMIIGGQALLQYGAVRLTEDIDITLGLDVDSLSRMKRVLKEVGLAIPKNVDDNFVKKTNVLVGIDKSTGIRVDFVFSFTTYENQALERARKVRIGNCNVNFASCEDMIIHKIFAGRARDLEDVRVLLELNIAALDTVYIKKWLKEFSKVQGYSLLKEFERIANKKG